MAIVIQNLACFETQLNKGGSRVYFNEDILKGKKIKYLFLQFSEESSLKSPFDDNFDVASPDFFTNFSLFLNIVSTNNEIIAKDLNYENVSYFPSLITRFGFIHLDMNNTIDTEKSYLSIYTNSPPIYSGKLLVYVAYETERISLTNAVMTGCFTVTMPKVENVDIKLSDIVNATLSNKKIKKITANIDQFQTSKAYLMLRCKNKLLEYMPFVLMYNTSILGTKEIFLDNLEIDFENSYIRNPDSLFTDITITFYY